MQKSIGIYSPNPLDATSFYRGFGPLSHVRRWMGDVLFRQLGGKDDPRFSRVSLGFCDAVFMQRPFTSEHVQAAEMVRAEGIPLWLDYDDDLLSVPMSNPTHRTYADPNRQKNVAKLIQIADLVSVSSEFLKNKYDVLREKAERETQLGERRRCLLIPNAIDDQAFRRKPIATEPRNKVVVWRGGSTHDGDLSAYTMAYASVMARHPDWTFNFVGRPFWMTINRLPQNNLLITPPMEIREYFDYLAAIKPAILTVPLEDLEFNQAKSNIAWLEASWAGAACLGPDWPEWRRPGMVRYNSPAQFAALLDDMISGKIKTAARMAESWAYIEEHVQLRSVNVARMEAIKWLMQEAENRGGPYRYAPK